MSYANENILLDQIRPMPIQTQLTYVKHMRNLLKIMFSQSRDKVNIDYYRPERILRSNQKVKLKSKFTRITKIQRSPYYRGIGLWDALPHCI